LSDVKARGGRAIRFGICSILCLSFLFAPLAHAADYDYIENPPNLGERLTAEVIGGVFPEADRAVVLVDADPPAAAAFHGDELVGYIFSTLEVVRAHGYSGTPFDVVAGVDLDGRITGALSLFHREPLIIEDDRLTRLTQAFLTETTGMSSRTGATDGPEPGYIAGATTSARAFRNAIRDSARLVLRAQLGRPVVTEPTLDIDSFTAMGHEELLADGSISSITITNADLADLMERVGADAMTLEVPPRGGPEEIYLQLRAGLATPAMIGRNAAGRGHHDSIFSDYPPGTQAIFLASNGRYDFLGHKFQNRSSGFRLERLRVLQGDRTFEFDKSGFIRAGIRLGKVSGMVLLPPESGFDPLQPWRAEVVVQTTDGTTIALSALDYRLPDRHILMPEPEPVPAWIEAWQQSWVDVTILGAALLALTAILAFQGALSRRRSLHRFIRNGFLLFTLVWLGWGVGAQLSIVHVINYLKAPFQNLDIGFYLAEPLIVMLSIYTAISLLLIGRGVFCGWLCPFGALQELLAQATRPLRLPQWNPGARLNGQLWWGKYVSFGVVVGLAFLAPTAGSVAAEIEPFKTAISSHFVRFLPYVLYAVLLLSLGLFTERAFCRFLCPLGGALAILDRLHLLTLLKRRPECGSPCKLCEHSCPVRAIEPSGKIKMAECFQCLDCQVEYYDDHRCPPLAKQRKQRERSSTGKGRNIPVFTRNAVAGR
jgi:NosR/NirI family nitrous oxide reductase transcriptional regulator